MMDQRTKAVGTTLGVLATGASIAGGIGWFIGAENPETPAGYVGYVTQSPVFGESKFIKLQTGPASPGRHWMYDVKNISITPYSYGVLCRNPLSKGC